MVGEFFFDCLMSSNVVGKSGKVPIEIFNDTLANQHAAAVSCHIFNIFRLLIHWVLIYFSDKTKSKLIFIAIYL